MVDDDVEIARALEMLLRREGYDVIKAHDGMRADDYVTKPYNPQELLARVKSQLRRYMELGTHHDSGIDGVIRNGGLKLDRLGMQFSVDGDPVRLTGKEFGIMELLMSHPGVVFSAEKIYERVWQETAYSVENTGIHNHCAVTDHGFCSIVVNGS